MDMPTTPAAPERVLLPLRALRVSRRNTRRTGGKPVRQLARSIERVGLLQNLTVTTNLDGRHYEVEAGKRRLAALQLLVKRKRLPQSYEVPCLIVPDEAGRTASLTENTQRQAMHPADEFEAFKALVEDGRSVEDIAADFGVTPLTVQRRLRLANVSPRLLDYREDQVTLEQLMALAVRVTVHRGLVRDEDAGRAEQVQRRPGGDAESGATKQKKARREGSLSDKLARQLSAHRTVALQAETARQPAVALVAVVHALALCSFYGEQHTASPLQVQCTPQEQLERYAPDLPGSPAATALAEARQAWRDRLPVEAGELFATLRELPQDELLSLLAVCAAHCLDAVSPDEADTRAGELSAALTLDLAQWWTPTAAGYFEQISKARIVEAIGRDHSCRESACGSAAP